MAACGSWLLSSPEASSTATTFHSTDGGLSSAIVGRNLEGYRLYEIGVDGEAPCAKSRSPRLEEDHRIADIRTDEFRRRVLWIAGLPVLETDDVHPCYLPDGGSVSHQRVASMAYFVHLSITWRERICSGLTRTAAVCGRCRKGGLASSRRR